MSSRKGLPLHIVLFINGIADVLVALMLLAFPRLGLGLPGLAAPTSTDAFLAGGWGIATLAMGATRIWAWRKAELRLPTTVVAIIEGSALAAFSVYVLVTQVATLAQALMPLLFGIVFVTLYVLALTIWRTKPAPISG